jgi:4'-phosphopantetheinyl transferase
MPIIKVQKINKQSYWGLWFISESQDELQNLVEDEIDSSIINPNKKKEWLAGRALLKELVNQSGGEYKGTTKDEYGKPFLINHTQQISLSHSYPYVAALIDESKPVGIDLEQPKSKLLNIASRVLSEKELIDAGNDVVKHCVYWCAKEAMYKLYGKRGLHFSSELLVNGFTLENAGNLQGTILAGNKQLSVGLTYLIQPDYVVVLTQT